MARRLKTYQTSLGFFDLAIAAPSMKAALRAWGTTSNLFQQGFAKVSEDPQVVAATMSKPGVVLRRPVGTNEPFREQAGLPTHLSGNGHGSSERAGAGSKKQAPRSIDGKTARHAALAFERAQPRRESQRRKEEAAAARDRADRERAIVKADAALKNARREHEEKARELESRRAALDRRSQLEEARWHKQQDALEAALRRARE